VFIITDSEDRVGTSAEDPALASPHLQVRPTADGHLSICAPDGCGRIVGARTDQGERELDVLLAAWWTCCD